MINTYGILRGVQLLRFIAAILVVVAHLPSFAEIPFIGGANNIFLGSIGVDVFFCISGFVMFRALVESPSTTEAFIKFSKKRFFRIFPLYFICCVFSYLYLTMNGRADLTTLVSSIFFFPIFNGSNYSDPIINVGWTLNFEVFFYAIIAICIFLFNKSRMSAVIFFIMLASVVGCLSDNFFYFFNSILLEFGYGLFVGYLFYSNKLKVLNKYRKIIAIACLFFFMIAMTGKDFSSSILNESYVSRMYIYWEGYSFPRALVWGVPSSLVLLSVLLFEDVFSHKVIVLGDISYALYLTQVFVFSFFNLVYKYTLDYQLNILSPYCWSLSIILVCLSLSFVTYFFVEKKIFLTLNRK